MTVLLLGSTSPEASAQDCVDYGEPVSFVGAVENLDGGYDVATTGNMAAVADGYGGLRLISLVNPGTPFIQGTETGFYAENVAIEGLRAFVTSGMTPSLTIVSIYNAAAPTTLGQLTLQGRAYGVDAEGSYAYVANWNHGLQIVDVSDPATPEIAGTSPTTGYSVNVVVGGGYAYVSESSALRVVDVSDPLAPFEVASLPIGGDQHTGLFIDGDLLYFANIDLHIIDISNPLAPSVLSSYNTAGVAVDVVVRDRVAYVPTYLRNGFDVIDVSNSNAPSPVGRLDSPGSTFDVALTTNHVCITDVLYPAAMRVAPLQCPLNDTAVDDLPSPDLGGMLRLSASPNPFNPQVEVRFELTSHEFVSMEVLDPRGNLVYRDTGGSYPPGQHAIGWSGVDAQGRHVPSGSYFIVVSTRTESESIKTMLVR